MKQFALKNTNLIVSELALGTSNFGSSIEESRAFAQMDTFFDLGGRLIDTAHVYGNWEPGKDSPSEETVGKWLARTGRRHSVSISTKGGHPFLDDLTKMRLHKEELCDDLNGSLKKLGTETIDLYFLHRDDPDIPAAELLGFLEDQVRKGKIRYYGCSNWSTDRIRQAQEAAGQEGFKGFICNQAMSSLADINMDAVPPSNVAVDAELRAYHHETGMPLMAYMPLARGYFAKKLGGEEMPEKTVQTYENESNHWIALTMKNYLSAEADPVAYSLQYLTRQPFMTIPVAGFSTVNQLKQAVSALDAKIPGIWIDRLAELKKLQ